MSLLISFFPCCSFASRDALAIWALDHTFISDYLKAVHDVGHLSAIEFVWSAEGFELDLGAIVES